MYLLLRCISQGSGETRTLRMHRQCGEHRTGVSPTTPCQEGASWLAVPLCQVATPSTSPRFPSQDKGCFAPLATS